ncbi:hypothetical protein ACFPIJ_55055 [Dactylosporangium cerinum]|uniref:Uncharacterized protein n=1 Tax=Dactylosporangium cerinum TaxID=1434730 RepID=A0ABV9WEY6_9ACTN
MPDEHAWERVPVAFPNCVTAGPSGAVAHAVSRGATLCGIPVRRATTTPGCFAPDAASACPRCVQRAAATPGRPSPQELLHDKILAADAGPLRDALVEALKQGAPVHPWIRGASAGNVRSSVRLYGAMEGARQADEALRTEGPFGAAEVVTAARRFVVIMPRYTRPVIAARSVRPVAQTPFPAGLTPSPNASAGGTEHAVDGDATLCGIPAKQVTVVRHLFSAEHRSACFTCAERAAT